MLAGVLAADVCVLAGVGCFSTAVRGSCAADGFVSTHDVEVESIDDYFFTSVLRASTGNTCE